MVNRSETKGCDDPLLLKSESKHASMHENEKNEKIGKNDSIHGITASATGSARLASVLSLTSLIENVPLYMVKATTSSVHHANHALIPHIYCDFPRIEGIENEPLFLMEIAVYASIFIYFFKILVFFFSFVFVYIFLAMQNAF